MVSEVLTSDMDIFGMLSHISDDSPEYSQIGQNATPVCSDLLLVCPKFLTLLMCRPLALIMQAQTSTNDQEILQCLSWLKSSTAGTFHDYTALHNYTVLLWTNDTLKSSIFVSLAYFSHRNWIYA